MSGERGRSVSIVIPCYQEETNLRAGCLLQVGAYADRTDDILEVLVVDDGSADRSRELIASLAATHPKLRLLAEPHRGKAGAVMAGIFAARADYVLFTDMDQATPMEELDKLRPYLQQGYDVIVGSRASHRAGAPLVRRLMATGFILLRQVILDLGPVRDTQCGFKVLRTAIARAVCERLRVFRPGVQQAAGAAVTAGFDAELLFVARRLGARVVEVPVTWHYVGTRRVHPLRESWRGLLGLLAIRAAARRREYDGPAPAALHETALTNAGTRAEKARASAPPG